MRARGRVAPEPDSPVAECHKGLSHIFIANCRWREPLYVRFGLGGRLAFKPNKTLGGNWEGKAPAEAFTHQARQEPRTPVEIASNLKKKVRRPPCPDRTPL
jgi:hypothetical protein